MEISWTELASWDALAAETTGAYATRGKWIRGYGTKLVWNSFKSTLREPSKRSEAVIEETTINVLAFDSPNRINKTNLEQSNGSSFRS